MKLFIDTGSVAEVEEIARWGVLSGATTNPSLLAKGTDDPGGALRAICELVDGPVSAEVVATDAARMEVEGRALAAIDERIVVKLPFSADGLAAARRLSDDGVAINMTLVFSAAQAMLAAEAGARYVSCFMGRLDDIGVDSSAVVREIVEALGPERRAQVLAASIRSPLHAVTAARLGCEVATIPAAVLRRMLDHPLTSAGIERFGADWGAKEGLAEWLEALTAGAPAGA